MLMLMLMMKRAKKRKAQEAAVTNTKKISTYFARKDGAPQAAAEGEEDHQEVNLSEDDGEGQSIPDANVLGEAASTENPETASKTATNVEEDVAHTSTEGSHVGVDTSNDYTTDRGHFSSTRPRDLLLKEILAYGSCRPQGPFVQTEGRKFSKSYYTMKLPSGQEVPRIWLCYSAVLNKVYCEPCWLFGNRAEKLFRAEWVEGIDDWRHLSDKIKSHEKSQSHILAMVARSNFQSLAVIDQELELQIQKEASFWRQVLTRTFNIIMTLTKCNTALRGHHEKHGGSTITSGSAGNFLEIVQLMAKFDPIMQSLLEKETSRIKYLSPTIQNEIISLLAGSVKKLICNEVQAAQFFAIIVDSTLDCNRIDQISVSLRYCTVDESRKEVRIRESFIGFFESEDQSAGGFETVVMKAMEDNGIKIEKCRGQGYDGASTMSGSISGLQTRIRNRCATADYVHCAAHNLNLTICDGVKAIPTMSNFFDTLQSVFTFLHSSAPRWAISHGLLKKTFDSNREEQSARHSQIYKITPKKLCETRWEAKHNSVFALKFRYVDTLKALTKIALISKKTADASSANGIKRKLEKFEFILQLVLWENILRPLKITSKKMQSPEIDIASCFKLWENALVQLNSLQSNPELIFSEAEELAAKWKIKAMFEKKRVIKRKRFFDELAVADEASLQIQDDKLRFIAKFVAPVLKKLIDQMHSRFEGIKTIFELFSFLVPEALVSMSEEQIKKNVGDLRIKYENDISAGMVEQILTFVSCMKTQLSEIKTIRQLANLLLQFEITDSFPDIYTAATMFLTIPVTAASAERSFSKLKLIKNYLRSTMSQDRLSNIAILNIESGRTQELDLDREITQFAII